MNIHLNIFSEGLYTEMKSTKLNVTYVKGLRKSDCHDLRSSPGFSRLILSSFGAQQRKANDPLSGVKHSPPFPMF